MHPVLLDTIRAFRSAQDLAVDTLRDRLQIPLPASGLDWAKTSHLLDLEERGRSIGIAIRPHGFGVEMRFPSVNVDFDWGDRGETYGFDVWRLWNHCCENRLFLTHSTNDLVSIRVRRACEASELVSDKHLHYLPEERARFAPDAPSAEVSLPPPPEGLSSGTVALRPVKVIRCEHPPLGIVPHYLFQILLPNGSEAGHITFWMGDTPHLLNRLGHITFEIAELFRGNGYALQACRAIAPFVSAVCGSVIIVCDSENPASRRTIERLGAVFIEEVNLPWEPPRRRYLWTP